MTQIASPGTAGLSTGTIAAGPRKFFIDQLRWLVIVMVVVVHTVVTYSGIGSWYYVEPAEMGIAARLVFTLYQSFSQAFFMGLLFLIAATFVPAAYDRKGFARFLRDRLFRLGVPTLVYMLVLDPLITVSRALFLGEPVTLAQVGTEYARYVITLRFLGSSGPLWFAFALLVFSVIYAVARRTADAIRRPDKVRDRASRPAPKITHSMVAAVIAVIAVGSFLVRVVQPIGTNVLNMQLCFFTQYVVLFLVGLWIGRADLLRSLPSQFGRTWLRLAFAAGVPAWFFVGALGGALTGSMETFLGGWHWQSAGMALWESFFCVGICLGLIVVYRERMNARARITGFLSDNAFAVYVFHAPILVTISLALRQLVIAPLAKAGMVAVIAFAASLLFAVLIRSVPGLRRVFS
jgi:surface polysaccharide O-acyltransferase-like enzyme